ncbi:hypothetical protein BU16DRAFT_71150 [Lophium mytilinum]|uniref:Uncharacterized protein n=1 Tax=Lophium mytilinum TaxID=390894 RepID=A0A6A6QP94_9PEZI|nr:hypothetical protein BU16DRAFT_71150 [Lophium mytilinum]
MMHSALVLIMACTMSTALLLTTAIAHQTSVTSLFLPDNSEGTYNASVVAVSNSITTYILDNDCGGLRSGCKNFPVTYGPTWYEMRLDGTDVATYTFVEHCDLKGTTSAMCKQSEADTGSSLVAKRTYSISSLAYHPVTITKGLKKLTGPSSTQEAGAMATPPPAVVTVTVTAPATSVTSVLAQDDGANAPNFGSVVGAYNDTFTAALVSPCAWRNGTTVSSSCTTDPPNTITFGPGWYRYTTSISTQADGSPEYLTGRCDYNGTTAGRCEQNVGTHPGITILIPKESINYHVLTITAGLEKLANATGKRSSSYSAIPTKSSASKGSGDKAFWISVAGVFGIALAAFAL